MAVGNDFTAYILALIWVLHGQQQPCITRDKHFGRIVLVWVQRFATTSF